MPKAGTLRKTTISERPIARRRRGNPAPASNSEGLSPAPTIPHEEIAACAYAHFLGRGGQHGDDWEDWFRAEAELGRERVSEGSPPGL